MVYEFKIKLFLGKEYLQKPVNLLKEGGKNEVKGYCPVGCSIICFYGMLHYE